MNVPDGANGLSKRPEVVRSPSLPTHHERVVERRNDRDEVACFSHVTSDHVVACLSAVSRMIVLSFVNLHSADSSLSFFRSCSLRPWTSSGVKWRNREFLVEKGEVMYDGV